MFSIYDPKTGLISSRVRSRDQIRGRSFVQGNWDPDRYYVIRGQAVPFPPKPAAQDQVCWLWHSDLKAWQMDLAGTDAQARALRARYLAKIDRMNPAWWASLDEIQQAQYNQYRQDLLDMTDQPGWPAVITWPAAPDWL